MMLRLVVPFGIMLVVLSLAAGRFDVWGFWAWTATMWLSSVVMCDVLGRVSPELLAERAKPPSNRDRRRNRSSCSRCSQV